MIVPEDAPIQKFDRGTINSHEHMQICAYENCDHMNITSMMYWMNHYDPSTDQIDGSSYWNRHYMAAIKGNYSLPEEARSYLRWLLKGKLKDGFKE